MVTYCVSPDCVGLFLSHDELSDIRGAVSSCLSEAGLPPWGDMEAELFNRGGACLLIARPRAPALRRVGSRSPRLRRC